MAQYSGKVKRPKPDRSQWKHMYCFIGHEHYCGKKGLTYGIKNQVLGLLSWNRHTNVARLNRLMTSNSFDI